MADTDDLKGTDDMDDVDDADATSTASPPRLLRIYLNDHLMAATGGVAVARRSQRSNHGTPLGQFLEELVAKISEDRETLIRVMTALAVPVDRLKVAIGELGAQAGRLKLNGSLLQYSDLSRLLELEGLNAGVVAKASLWQNLAATVGADPRLVGVDFDDLVSRAEAQRASLEHHRLDAARRALVGGADG